MFRNAPRQIFQQQQPSEPVLEWLACRPHYTETFMLAKLFFRTLQFQKLLTQLPMYFRSWRQQ
eukprot:2961949-Amphidinium_carterae.1